MRFAIVSGTNRPDNLSLQVAKICQKFFDDQGVEVEMLDLEKLPRELAFGYWNSGGLEDFRPYQQTVDRCSHFIFVVPEYNGSIPGILKLFIDACEFPGSFRGKSALLVGIAAGKNGNRTGVAHLEDILRYCGMHVFPENVTLGRIREKLHPDGGFGDGGSEASLHRLLGNFLASATPA